MPKQQNMQQDMPSAKVTNAAFEQIKALAGEWEGTAQKMPVTTSYRVVSNGSAVMSVLGHGSEAEMVTMFHMDGPSTVMATHYCSAGNQPRMVMAGPGADPKVITFTFRDATNLAAPNAGCMQGLVITVVDADHHKEAWTYRQDGEDETDVFEFTRKKAAR